MNLFKKTMIGFGLLSMVAVSAPVAAAPNHTDRLSERDVGDIIGGIGGIIIDRIQSRKKAKYHCTAEGRRNRGRDVIGRGYAKARFKSRHQNAQVMKQVCLQALNNCINQFRRPRRGENRCVVVHNEIRSRYHGDQTIHRWNGRTIHEMHRGPGRRH